MTGARSHWNPVLNEWTVDAPGRKRKAVGRSCPFCPGADEVPLDYTVHFTPSKYPAFWSGLPEGDVARGCHEVFLFSPHHSETIYDQPLSRLVELLGLLGERSSTLFHEKAMSSVFSYVTTGDYLGPSVDHPHGQIVGMRFVPRNFGELSEAAGCLLCESNEASGFHPVHEGEVATARIPSFSRYPFETWISPTRHVGRLAHVSGNELESIASTLRVTLQRIASKCDGVPPTMLNIFEAPLGAEDRFHLRIEIVPTVYSSGRTKFISCLELGAGVFLNPTPAAVAAGELRSALLEP